MTLELQAMPSEVMRAVEAFQEFARTQQVPEKITFGLALALEECGSNIVNYALGHSAQQKFRVSFGRVGDEIFIELRDPGPEFDPTAWTASDSQTGDGDPIGGWGIELVRRHVDEMRYEREAGENILRLSKRLMPESAEFQKSQTKQS
jgi:anti-sigma regulatory factor (Ser/Thr protein kinase)